MKLIPFLCFMCVLGFTAAYVQSHLVVSQQQDVGLNSERKTSDVLSANRPTSDGSFQMDLQDDVVLSDTKDEFSHLKNSRRSASQIVSDRKKCKPRKCNCNCSTTGPSNTTTASPSTARTTTPRATPSTTIATTTSKRPTSQKVTTEDDYDGGDATDYPDGE